MFYWTMAGLSFAIALLSLVGLVRQMAEKEGRILRLTRSELRVPQGLFGKEAHVALGDVTNVRLRQVRGQLWLEIIHRHGKVNIGQILLPDAEAFRKVREFLSANTPTGVLGHLPPGARRTRRPGRRAANGPADRALDVYLRSARFVGLVCDPRSVRRNLRFALVCRRSEQRDGLPRRCRPHEVYVRASILTQLVNVFASPRNPSCSLSSSAGLRRCTLPI